MTVRHKPIHPKKQQKSKAKRRNIGEHQVVLTAEQHEAQQQWMKDFKKQLPLMQETASVAQRIFQELMDAPEWNLAEGPRPQGSSMLEHQPKMWKVGNAKVNYVKEGTIKRPGESE